MTNSLNSFLFSTPEMARIFSSAEQLRAMMRFEWALTCALESQGLAEPGAGAVLESMQNAEFVNFDALEEQAKDAGNIAIPFVRQLIDAVRAKEEPASRAIHLGATSQDVLDTALALEMRAGLALLDQALKQLDSSLTQQARTHRKTILSGRTWLQPGPPTTLGLKLAGTVAALRRHRDRLQSAAQRVLVLQFGGAVGTLAPLGSAGGTVTSTLAQLLELQESDVPWHSQRDNLVEIVQVLAGLTGSLAKFARDVALLMQPEIGEVSQGGDDARGGSSTMPHKHNPVACAAVVAAHARMPGLVATMLLSMPQEHERGLGLWQAEWETVPEAFRLTAAALAYSIEIAEGLQVYPERMQANLNAQLGLTMSEAVSTALAPKIGRATAHDLLRKASARATEERQHIGHILKQMPEITAHLRNAEIDQLLDPRNYLGSAERFIIQVVGDPDAHS